MKISSSSVSKDRPSSAQGIIIVLFVHNQTGQTGTYQGVNASHLSEQNVNVQMQFLQIKW